MPDLHLRGGRQNHFGDIEANLAAGDVQHAAVGRSGAGSGGHDCQNHEGGGRPVSQLTVMIDPEKCSLLRAAPRLIQILRVLARHKFLGALRGKKHWPPPKAVRETFEELGLTFIKFGQVLALRRDLLPDAYIEELELLHDQLPAMGMEAVRTTVETELGAPLTELFSSFSETPLAAATIAQVHEATMQDGRHVAVKVQRPGLKAMIATDVAAMTYLV